MAPKCKGQARPPLGSGRARGAARGGAGRGQGRKPTSATPSVNKAAGANPGDKRIQQSLGQMLGARTSPAMKRPAVLKADVISWEAEVNEEMKLQKQVKEGPVRYPFGDPDAEYILLQAGTAFTEHTGWFDSSGKLVPEGDAQAVRSAKMGGPAYLQIREVGKEGSEKWVTKGHVQALSFGKRQCLAEELGAREGSSSADRSGAGEGGSGDQLEEEGGEEEITREEVRKGGSSSDKGSSDGSSREGAGGGDDDSEEESGEEAGKEGGRDGVQARPALGAGRKAAVERSRKGKQKMVRPQRVKGHTFQPRWLTANEWLRTFPDRTAAEWDELPAEAPEYMYCVCCVAASRGGAHDVLTKKKGTSVRGDKIAPHSQNEAHKRAFAAWKAAQPKPSASGSSPAATAVAIADSSIPAADLPLAALVRTVCTVAVTKTAISLVDVFVQLQLANFGAVISTSHTHRTDGVQQFLHAAATVLRRQQDERLRRARFFSDCGDGSSDRKTIEQEIIYVRYPVFGGDPKQSLSGFRVRAEYFDLLEVDVTFSSDKKSFDANAVLRSTYHTAFLERGLASLPAELPTPQAPPAAAQVGGGRGRGTRRGAATPGTLKTKHLSPYNPCVSCVA